MPEILSADKADLKVHLEFIGDLLSKCGNDASKARQAYTEFMRFEALMKLKQQESGGILDSKIEM